MSVQLILIALSASTNFTSLFSVIVTSVPSPSLITKPSPISIVSSFGVVTEPPSDTAEPLIVIDEFANLPFAILPANLSLLIEPANWALDTPPDLIVTSPDDTAKSAVLNLAIPLFESVASSPDISPAPDISIPSPAVNLLLTCASLNWVFVSVEVIVKFGYVPDILVAPAPVKATVWSGAEFV